MGFQTDLIFEKRLSWAQEFVKAQCEPLGRQPFPEYGAPYDVGNEAQGGFLAPLRNEVRKQDPGRAISAPSSAVGATDS